MQNKKLQIKRSFRDDEGKHYTRSEIVTDPAIIEAYVRSRQQPHTPVNDWELSGSGFREWQHKEPSRTQQRKRRKRPSANPPRKRPKSDKVLNLKVS